MKTMHRVFLLFIVACIGLVSGYADAQGVPLSCACQVSAPVLAPNTCNATFTHTITNGFCTGGDDCRITWWRICIGGSCTSNPTPGVWSIYFIGNPVPPLNTAIDLNNVPTGLCQWYGDNTGSFTCQTGGSSLRWLRSDVTANGSQIPKSRMSQFFKCATD